MHDMKTIITPELYNYACSISKPEHHVLKMLRDKTATMPGSQMQISTDQGQFMAMLAKIIGVNKYLEIGVYTGYSALAVTLATNKDSQTYALDIDPKTMEIAQEFWNMANVSNKIKPMLGDALESLEKLKSEGHLNTFDMAFIDAKKSDYIDYFKYCNELVRPGGVILIDNIFMQGQVVSDPQSSLAISINDFNKFIKESGTDYCVTIIADGLTIVRKN